MPLLATRFELVEYRTVIVQFNYHIAVDRMYCSVSYQYIKDKVDVRVTDTIIEISKDFKRKLLPTNTCTGIWDSISWCLNICHQIIRNIWSGTVTVSANGQKQSESIPIKL